MTRKSRRTNPTARDRPAPAPQAEPWVVVALVLPMAAAGVTDRLDPFVAAELSQVVNAVAWVTLLGYLIRRSGSPPADFGLARPDWLIDGCTALLLVPCLWWVSGWTADLWTWAGLPPGQPRYQAVLDATTLFSGVGRWKVE